MPVRKPVALPSCGACRFFRAIDGTLGGTCRAGHPVPLVVGTTDVGGKVVAAVSSYWPQTLASEWCGEWERAA